ncbi:MAG: methyltransferase domain-containing protein [Gemmatimonadetes bacterium]|nr:methyltransferase domain-containing protein [Gemmatimonadota bacterium]
MVTPSSGYDSGTAPLSALASLSGDALHEALARRIRLAEVPVPLGGDTVRLVKPANADDLITEADYVFDERLPYWADLWPSSHVLAGEVLAMAGDGRALLELGCGSGLVTVAALRAGFAVTATDYYADAVHMTRLNAWRLAGREPTGLLVDWRAWPDGVGVFDVVVAADVLYEKPYATLVAQAIARSLAPGGTAWVADPGRLAQPEFRAQLPEAGLVLRCTRTVPYEEGTIRQRIELLEIGWAEG